MSEPSFAMRSGIQALVQSVDGYLRANRPGTVVAFGRRELTKQSNQGIDGANRVVFAPPDDGKMGALSRMANPGPFRTIPNPKSTTQVPLPPIGRVRALFQWDALLLVSCWAKDPTAENDELAQFAAVEGLHEWTVRAVNAAKDPSGEPLGAANAIWGKVTWILTPVEKINGAEGRYELTLRLPVYDVPEAFFYPTANPLGTDSPKHPPS